MKALNTQPRLLTGDTPTGRLHLGHWVGSIENRLALQESHECYFLIANVHAFTTRWDNPQSIYESVVDIVLDYLACGIDPQKSTICLQSELPAIAELTFFFSMLISYPRLMRNPTLKDEIRDKNLGDHYPFGFLLYPVGQVADVLCFRPEIVPVGEDQVPHLELMREVARKFNHLYCGVDPHVPDDEAIAAGGLFPVAQAKVGRVERLVGTGGPAPGGTLLKMSKSLNNAIFLSDDPDAVKKKVMAMYTDPCRIRATDPGTTENNPLWIFHETFNPDKAWVAENKARYRAGQISDVACKQRLIDVLVALIEPIRQRRLEYARDGDTVSRVLRLGTERAQAITSDTVLAAKQAMKQCFF